MVKPGSLTNRTLSLIVEARGEAKLVVAFTVTMTRFETSSGTVIATNGSINLDQPSFSAFGQHIEWKQRPPAAIWTANLDGSQLQYTDTLRHDFAVRLACESGEPSCAADGDTITMVIQVTSPQDSRPNLQEVRIRTSVESLISCEESTVQMTQAGMIVAGTSISAETPMAIRVQAVDVDGLNISHTRAEITFLCGNRTLLLRPWSPGSNEYVAEIPAGLLLELGQFDLVVRALNGWNRTGREQAPCDLLRVNMVARMPFKRNILTTVERAFVGISVVLLVFVLTGVIVYWRCLRMSGAKRLAARKIQLLRALQQEYSTTGNLGPMDRVNPDGALPIHYALECGAPDALVRAILSKYPEGAKTRDARGNLPLHLMLHGLSSQTQWKVASSSMHLLLEAFPGGKLELDMHKKLPIQIFLEAGLLAADSCDLGVELGFPLDCNGRAGNWHYVLANSANKVLQPPKSGSQSTVLAYEWLAEMIIQHAQETRRATIQQLAYATDTWGREAWAVATKEHRKCIWKYLLFCGRYDRRS
jgi:hypothetical protein